MTIRRRATAGRLEPLRVLTAGRQIEVEVKNNNVEAALNFIDRVHERDGIEREMRERERYRKPSRLKTETRRMFERKEWKERLNIAVTELLRKRGMFRR